MPAESHMRFAFDDDDSLLAAIDCVVEFLVKRHFCVAIEFARVFGHV